jgi:uncharacterized protein YeaO (DUF488 family)
VLKQGSVKQIRTGEITRGSGYVAITMCFYPRGLRKELRDEYRKNLAPDNVLFKEWQVFEKAHGHEAAFRLSRYEDRFTLSEEALENLRRLSELARKQDVYLICQCAVGERCHREILLLEAKRRFRAKTGKVFHTYPRYFARLGT